MNKIRRFFESNAVTKDSDFSYWKKLEISLSDAFVKRNPLSLIISKDAVGTLRTRFKEIYFVVTKDSDFSN